MNLPQRAGRSTLTAILALLLAACGANDHRFTAEGPSADAQSPENPRAGNAPATASVLAAARTRDEVKTAVADLAERKSVAPEQISVAAYHSVTWRDGAIGCPQPGMAYTQALVPGHLLLLELDGERFHYHAGRSGTFAYCANPDQPLPDETM